MAKTSPKYPNRLRQIIKQHGLTIQGVAEETDIPLRTLSDYCAGLTPIPKERLETVARFIGCPPDYLVPVYPALGSPYLVQSEHNQANVWIPSRGNSVDTLRRKFLQQLLCMTGATLIVPAEELIHPDAWERLTFALNSPYHTDAQTVTQLETLTDTYWELYRSAIAKVDLLSSVSGHLLTLTHLLRSSQPVAIQHRLCSILSNTAQIVGEIYLDMNERNKFFINNPFRVNTGY